MSCIADIVLTVGHSTHEVGPFLELLRGQGIEALVDVRRHPGSRRVPWTRAGELAGLLSAAGVAYEHAPDLGGRRRPEPGSPNGGWRDDQFRGYADHMATPEFAAALDRLAAAASSRRTAVMCAEAQWWRCHRRLLADALLVRGIEVRHLDGRGGSAPHVLTEFAVVEGGGLTYRPAQAELG